MINLKTLLTEDKKKKEKSTLQKALPWLVGGAAGLYGLKQAGIIKPIDKATDTTSTALGTKVGSIGTDLADNTAPVYIDGQLVGTKNIPTSLIKNKKPSSQIMVTRDGVKLYWNHGLNQWSNVSDDDLQAYKVRENISVNKNILNEVGASPQHKKFIKNIYKAEENMHKHIMLYKNFLNSQGLKKEANEIGSKYVGIVGKFTHWMKITWTKMVRKMI